MIVDGKKQVVHKGDAVITHSGSAHGLINTQSRPLTILVFEAKY